MISLSAQRLEEIGTVVITPLKQRLEAWDAQGRPLAQEQTTKCRSMSDDHLPDHKAKTAAEEVKRANQREKPQL